MKNKDNTHPRRTLQRGLTLVELMIGLVIGLVMTGAISYLFIDASRNYRITENLARMQESARFAFDKIGRDARGAGYYGCVGEEIEQGEKSLDNLLRNNTAYLYNFETAVEAHVAPETGWPATMSGFVSPTVLDDFDTASSDSEAVVPLPSSHILALRGVPDGEISVYAQPEGASIKFSNTNALKEHDIVLVTTCKEAAVFQITGVQPPQAANDFTNVTHRVDQTHVPGNERPKTWTDLIGGEVMMITTSTYFIAEHPVHGRNSLFRHTGRVDASGNLLNANEIARNVVDMKIWGGIDNNNDRQIDRFLDLSLGEILPADWERVRAIRVQLTLESEDQGLAPNGAPLTYTTTTTFALRNRLP